MTSGTFKTFPIASITIDREKRQRRELKNISELAKSIEKNGLINPIVITRAGVLIAGERRLEACRSLGRQEIMVQFAEDLPPEVLQRIELEENIRRDDLPWQDQCRAIQTYHNLRLSTEPTWSRSNTAEALNITWNEIDNKLSVAKALDSSDSRIVKAPSYSVARNIVVRAKARQQDAVDAELQRDIGGVTAPQTEEPEVPILNEDFLKWAPNYIGKKFNLLHCDFPYGIGSDQIKQGSAVAKHGGYADTEETYWTLVNCLLANLDRLVTPSCHLVFWFSMGDPGCGYIPTYDYLQKRSPFTIEPFPWIWVKSDNAGVLPDPSRGARRIYESAFFGHMGDRKIIQAVGNAYGAPTVKDLHMSVKPEPMLRHFFRMLVDEHTRLLDPTCGSGSALRVADGLGAQAVLGLEVNKEFADRAAKTFQQGKALRKITEEIEA